MGIGHRLRGAVRQVHDLQPTMAQGNRPLRLKAPGVRAAWGQVVGDAFHGRKVRRLKIEAQLTS